MKHLLRAALALNLKALLLVSLLIGAVSGVQAEEVTYSFTISPSDFNSSSYAGNNSEKTSTAVCTTDDTKKMDVKWTSNQVMLNSSAMQWQKSKGYIYNSTDLGTIKSVTVNSSAGTFTTYYGTSVQPSSSTTVGDGFFQVKVGGATGSTSSIVVVFTVSINSDEVETTTEINGSGITNTDINSGTNAGSLSAVVKDESNNVLDEASVAWSSSNESVATIDEAGIVTLVAAGSTTITASYAGVENQYKPSVATYTLTVTDSSIITLWEEDFSAFSAGGTYSYVVVNGSSDTRTYDQTNAGGTSPELLVGNTGGSFQATIPLNNIEGTLTLTYKTNANSLTVSTTTKGVSGGGTYSSSGTHKVTFTGVTTEMTSIVIKFAAGSKNVRLDDILLTGKAAAIDENQVLAPVITATDGLFLSSKAVTIDCETAGATIQYSTDGGENWSTYTGTFNINETTTIIAKATKEGMTDSYTSEMTITKETVYDGISAFTKLRNGTYYVNLEDDQVTYVTGTNGFMEDATAGVYMYKTSPSLNTVYSGIYQMTLNIYNGLPELTNIVELEGQTTMGSDKTATLMETDALVGAWTENLGRKIELSSVEITNVSQLTDDITISNQVGDSFVPGFVYMLTGYPYINNNKQQFYLTGAVKGKAITTLVFENEVSGDVLTSIELRVGNTADVSVNTNSTATFTVTSSDTNVATWKDGVITAIGAGTATLTATVDANEIYSSKTATLIVNVVNGQMTGTVSFDVTTASLALGETTTYTATTNSSAAISYSSSDESIATVDPVSGLVTAIAVGEATITAAVAETDLYTAARATYKVKVIEYIALVAQYGNQYFAVDGSDFSSGTYGATEVDAVNGKVISKATDAISWVISTTTKTANIKNRKTSSYIGYNSSTNLSKLAATYSWTIDKTNSSWLDNTGGTRSFVYRDETGFRAYAVSNIGDSGYATSYTQAYTFASGYSRTVTAGAWGTICLPNDVAADDYAGVKFYSIAGKDKAENPTSITLQEVRELEAGVPYIFQANEDATKLVAAYGKQSVATAGSYNGLTGSLEGQEVDEGMYLLFGGKIKLCGTGCSIDANRAYIDMSQVPVVSAGVKGVTFFFNGEVGVNGLEADSQNNTPVYDLTGRRVSKTQHGLYIVNGKKVIVK